MGDTTITRGRSSRERLDALPGEGETAQRRDLSRSRSPHREAPWRSAAPGSAASHMPLPPEKFEKLQRETNDVAETFHGRGGPLWVSADPTHQPPLRVPPLDDALVAQRLGESARRFDKRAKAQPSEDKDNDYDETTKRTCMALDSICRTAVWVTELLSKAVPDEATEERTPFALSNLQVNFRCKFLLNRFQSLYIRLASDLMNRNPLGLMAHSGCGPPREIVPFCRSVIHLQEIMSSMRVFLDTSIRLKEMFDGEHMVAANAGACTSFETRPWLRACLGNAKRDLKSQDPSGAEDSNKDYERLLFHLLSVAAQRKYRKGSDGLVYAERMVGTLHEPNDSASGTSRGTRNWVPVPFRAGGLEVDRCSMRAFILSETTKEENYEKWVTVTNERSLNNAERYLKESHDAEFPFLQISRDYISFNNGIYRISQNEFFKYGEGRDRGVPPEICTGKYIPHPEFPDDLWAKLKSNQIHWRDIPTPHFQSILDYQNYGRKKTEDVEEIAGEKGYVLPMCSEQMVIKAWETVDRGIETLRSAKEEYQKAQHGAQGGPKQGKAIDPLEHVGELVSRCETLRDQCAGVRSEFAKEKTSTRGGASSSAKPAKASFVPARLPVEVQEWLFVLMGRMFYDVGEHDNWQVIPFIQGMDSKSKPACLITLGCHVVSQ